MSLCKKPYMSGSQPYGCGQCIPCRINRRRLWTHRIMLEARMHDSSCFLTLTYDDTHLPQGGTLVRKDLQKFQKALRSRFPPGSIRFFSVGEYGETSQRPHYHLAVFGLGPGHQEIYNDVWKKGFTYAGELTTDSAQYIAGYTVKKMTNKNNPQVHAWLNGREPEFAQPSLKPGIGATAMETLCNAITTEYGYLTMQDHDVPLALQHGKKKLPLGRYLRSKLRGVYGFQETKTPKEVLEKLSQEMYIVLEEALKKPENKNKTLGTILVELNTPKRLSLEKRAQIFSKKGNL